MTELELHEEVLLLCLHDEKGTLTNDTVTYGMAGGLLAELMLAGRIAIDDTKKARVSVVDPTPTGKPEIDAALSRIAEDDKSRKMTDWVSKLAVKALRERSVDRLCDAGILRREQSRVLWIFDRTRYPEANPDPEQDILDRLREAVRRDGEVDPRTAALVSIANGMSLLKQALSKDELKQRKARIEQIAAGQASGKALAQVIDAINTALVVAVIMPAIITPTITN